MNAFPAPQETLREFHARQRKEVRANRLASLRRWGGGAFKALFWIGFASFIGLVAVLADRQYRAEVIRIEQKPSEPLTCKQLTEICRAEWSSKWRKGA